MLGIIILLTIIGFLGVVWCTISRVSLKMFLLTAASLVGSSLLYIWYQSDNYVKHLFIYTLHCDENLEKYVEDLHNDDVELFLLEERDNGTKKYRMVTNKGMTFEGILSLNRNKLTNYVKR